MLTKDEIESWNEIFPDCKIKQAELSNPIFLTKALTSYLRKFGYNVNMQSQQKNNDADNLRDHRVFQIKLAQHIDRMLKITDKAYNFTYYDLTHPTPKKTCHILSILLNYLYYFNLYKTEVFNRASEAIKTRDELLKRIKEVEQENQNRKIKAEKIKNKIDQYTEELPEAEKLLSLITAEKQKHGEAVLQLEEAYKVLKIKLNEFDTEKRSLKKRVVSDIEANELQTQLKKLQQKIAEQTEQEAATKITLKEITDSIKTMQDSLKNIRETKEMLPLHELTLSKDVDKQLKDIKIAIETKLQHTQDLLLQIEKNQNELQTLKEKHKLLKTQNESAKSQQIGKSNALEKECNANEEQIAHCQQELRMLDCQYEEQLDVCSYLRENIEKLMHPYLK